MFILSFKLDNRRLIILVLIIVAAVMSGGLLLINKQDSFTDAAKTNSEYYFNRVETNEDRIKFLNQFGWGVAEEAEEIIELEIPEEFDTVYNKYNEIQKELGLNLEKYMGRRVKRYTYRVLNYQGDYDQVLANIIIYRNNVIAGDIMTTDLDGFMHSLKNNNR
jgi:hypothetical protein